MRVYVRSISGQETREFEVGDNAALEHLDTLICVTFGLDPTNITASLLYGDSVLTDPKASLMEFGIHDGALLTVVVRRRQKVLTASVDGTAKIWDASTGDCKLTLEGHQKRILSALFSAR